VTHPHEHEPSDEDVQKSCDHVWPSDLDFNEGRCESCGLPYAEWSA
jgi:hypothetical protein